MGITDPPSYLNYVILSSHNPHAKRKIRETIELPSTCNSAWLIYGSVNMSCCHHHHHHHHQKRTVRGREIQEYHRKREWQEDMKNESWIWWKLRSNPRTGPLDHPSDSSINRIAGKQVRLQRAEEKQKAQVELTLENFENEMKKSERLTVQSQKK